MNAELVKSLKGLADVQSLRSRTTELEITFRSPMVKQALSVAVELFKWHRYRSSSQKIALHAMSSSLQSRPGQGSSNMRDKWLNSYDAAGGSIENLEGTDVAGSDLEPLDQDTENEVHGADESQQVCHRCGLSGCGMFV
jgi:hypothetical protein